jgi:hypothetical protein
MMLTATRTLTCLVIALVALSQIPIHATNAYRLHTMIQLKLDPNKPITCLYCHITKYGGDTWNSFGTLISSLYYGSAKYDFPTALYQALAARKDSDQDGYIDILEVVAKTLPADKNSRPSQSISELNNQLTRLGGIAAFRK